VILALLACAAPDAEPGSVVLPGDDVVEPWDEAYADADDIGGLFPMSAWVVGPDGAAASGVRVSVLSGWDGATVRAPRAPVGALALDVRRNEVVELGHCAPGSSACTWLELVTGSDGRINFDVFVDDAPAVHAAVPLFISAGDDVAEVEIQFTAIAVVH